MRVTACCNASFIDHSDVCRACKEHAVERCAWCDATCDGTIRDAEDDPFCSTVCKENAARSGTASLLEALTED